MGRLSSRVRNMINDNPLPQQQDKLSAILSSEHTGKFGVIDDIKAEPIPEGVATEIISGIPIDWHDLEAFVVEISPVKFVTLLKLQKQMIKEYGSRFKNQKQAISGKIILLILLAVGLAVAGILVIMYMPQLTALFQGGF